MNVSTVNISFPKSLLKAIDDVAARESRTRSDLLREATRLYIERKKRLNKMFAFWRAETAARRIKSSDIDKAILQVRKSK